MNGTNMVSDPATCWWLYTAVAQLAESRSPKAKVEGSNPSCRACARGESREMRPGPWPFEMSRRSAGPISSSIKEALSLLHVSEAQLEEQRSTKPQDVSSNLTGDAMSSLLVCG